MTDQIIPYGGTVEVSSDGSTFTSIPEPKGIPVPQTETEYPEVTSLDSPNGFREFIPGLKDGGTVSFVIGYTPAGYAILDGLNADTLLTWRCTFPLAPSQASTGGTFTFTGYISFAPDASDVGAPVDVTINIRVSGSPTWTQGA